jgi:hypothetical protein
MNERSNRELRDRTLAQVNDLARDRGLAATACVLIAPDQLEAVYKALIEVLGLAALLTPAHM